MERLGLGTAYNVFPVAVMLTRPATIEKLYAFGMTEEEWSWFTGPEPWGEMENERVVRCFKLFQRAVEGFSGHAPMQVAVDELAGFTAIAVDPTNHDHCAKVLSDNVFGSHASYVQGQETVRYSPESIRAFVRESCALMIRGKIGELGQRIQASVETIENHLASIGGYQPVEVTEAETLKASSRKVQ